MEPRWKRTLTAAILLCAAGSVKWNPPVPRPVAKFILVYQQAADLNLWDRVVYSLLLTKSTAEPSS
jgi:hypothetical protein